jgi:hypothetical protein
VNRSNPNLDDFIRNTNDGYVNLLPSDVLRRYDEFLARMQALRARRLRNLDFREKVLTFTFVITTIATCAIVCTVIVLTAISHVQNLALMPFAVICLAVLAVLLKQFQLQTQKRANVLLRDNRSEELVRSAVSAYLAAREEVPDRLAFDHLIGALIALQSAQDVERETIQPLGVESPQDRQQESSPTWDPISVFLKAG